MVQQALLNNGVTSALAGGVGGGGRTLTSALGKDQHFGTAENAKLLEDPNFDFDRAIREASALIQPPSPCIRIDLRHVPQEEGKGEEKEGTTTTTVPDFDLASEISGDAEHAALVDEFKNELARYGEVIAVVIPRPSKGDQEGFGFAFIQFGSLEASAAALKVWCW